MYPATPQFYSFPTRRSSDLRSYRRGGTVLGEVVLDQPLAEVIAGSLREHLSGQQPRGRGHPAGQIAQAQAEAGGVQVVGGRAPQEGVQLAQPAILATGVAEVLPGLESGRDRR